MYDVDNSGSVTLSELLKGIDNNSGVVDSEDITTIFNTLDVDGSGCIDIEEFMHFYVEYITT